MDTPEACPYCLGDLVARWRWSGHELFCPCCAYARAEKEQARRRVVGRAYPLERERARLDEELVEAMEGWSHVA